MSYAVFCLEQSFPCMANTICPNMEDLVPMYACAWVMTMACAMSASPMVLEPWPAAWWAECTIGLAPGSSHTYRTSLMSTNFGNSVYTLVSSLPMNTV